eukprot:TRINITY_DN75133_c0_g1_i1.p1 TRINITY_DN75133_c0_g1~~TRINITY_DN75133_c0_g1_i1.p1  ORF type:complete len:1261 (-),score=303.02 TRINITY_DN75133_c0_g1_i1:82-3864(-)
MLAFVSTWAHAATGSAATGAGGVVQAGSIAATVAAALSGAGASALATFVRLRRRGRGEAEVLNKHIRQLEESLAAVQKELHETKSAADEERRRFVAEAETSATDMKALKTELDRVIHELQRAEGDAARRKAWQNALGAVVVVADCSGRLLELNERAAAEFGCSETTHLGKRSVADFIHPDDHKLFAELEASSVTASLGASLQQRKSMSRSISPPVFKSTKAGDKTVSRDVSDSSSRGSATAASSAARASAVSFCLQSSASSSSSSTSQQTPCLSLGNQLKCRMVSGGLSPAPTTSRRRSSSNTSSHSSKGENASLSHVIWRDVLVTATPWRGANGASGGVIYVGQDIAVLNDERQQIERMAEDRERLLQNVNALVIGVDVNGRVTEWNRRTEIVSGFTRAEAMGKNLVQAFVTRDSAESVQTMLSQGLQGQEIMNYEFSIFTKHGEHREILWSATARRNHEGQVIGTFGVGQDISELRSESKMLQNYVRICGAAVWSLRGHAATGAVAECKTKEIEHLISQQAQMDVCDPRMVLWRASFVAILKAMCQNFWMRRKETQGLAVSGVSSTSTSSTAATSTTTAGASPNIMPRTPQKASVFGYEFCFEAPNGQVKWYKVEGHLIEASPYRDGQFEVSGSMQEVTEMWIDKVMGDRRSSMWSRMCHMVFDATLLVDTQEYRVLNAWGEEKVFGYKLQSNHPVLQLIKAEDAVSLKEAFNEVTFKGSERGRTLHLLRLGQAGRSEISSQCFLMAADPENPNECMIGIRMDRAGGSDNSMLWDVAKPNPVLTLEDLAVLKSGLKRHRRPRNIRSSHHRQHARSSEGHGHLHTSARSLSSIPEDLHGESEDAADSGGGFDTESICSSSKSSTSSKSSASCGSNRSLCNSSTHSPPRSLSEEFSAVMSRSQPSKLGSLGNFSSQFDRWNSNSRVPTGGNHGRSPTAKASGGAEGQLASLRCSKPAITRGPPVLKLKWGKQSWDLNLDNFGSVIALRAHVEGITGVPSGRQTLILAGKRLPLGDEALGSDEPTWVELKNSVRPGQTMMLIGNRDPNLKLAPPGAPAGSPIAGGSPSSSPEAKAASAAGCILQAKDAADKEEPIIEDQEEESAAEGTATAEADDEGGKAGEQEEEEAASPSAEGGELVVIEALSSGEAFGRTDVCNTAFTSPITNGLVEGGAESSSPEETSPEDGVVASNQQPGDEEEKPAAVDAAAAQVAYEAKVADADCPEGIGPKAQEETDDAEAPDDGAAQASSQSNGEAAADSSA